MLIFFHFYKGNISQQFEVFLFLMSSLTETCLIYLAKEMTFELVAILEWTALRTTVCNLSKVSWYSLYYSGITAVTSKTSKVLKLIPLYSMFYFFILPAVFIYSDKLWMCRKSTLQRLQYSNTARSIVHYHCTFTI